MDHSPIPNLRARSADLDPVAVCMGVLFALIWSSAFTSAKIALQDAPPFLMLAIRFLLSGAVGIAIGLALGQSLPRSSRSWIAIGFLGICQNSLYLGLFFLAMTEIPAGIAAMIASAMPLIVAVAGPVLFAERLGAQAILGLILGFGGVVLIMSNHIGAGDGSPFGYLICIVGVISLGVATLVVRHVKFDTGLMMVVGLQMLIGGLVLVPVALMRDSVSDVTPTLSLLIAFTYTTFVPGLIATMMWFHLIGRIGATRASVYHFLNPVFGVSIAWLLLAEPLGPWDAAGVVIVTIGILAVQLERAR